jgi:hypothetical protein
MNAALKKIAFLTGLGILFVSVYWSQDGWNFNMAGDSGYTQEAIAIGWFLAIAVSVIQFVFSSNFRELNMSLIALGGVAYWYSIRTNKDGILHFQGNSPDELWAWVLGFLMDASAEPLIAWSLGVAREGDFLGNIVKSVLVFFNGIFDGIGDNRGSKTSKSSQMFSTSTNRPNQHNKPDKREFVPKFDLPKGPNYRPAQGNHGGHGGHEDRPNLHIRD